MLERLRVRNFQNHEDLRIVFDPLITTIVGSSDAGKSAAIRAVRWLMQNRPRGDEFLRVGSDEVSVMLWLDDGRKIERARSKKTNVYRLDGQDLVAMGTEVPQDIAALLNIDDGNFQGQHDGPFWLFDSPPTVSRNLNAIIDLGDIDAAMDKAAQLQRQANADAKAAADRLKIATNDVEALADVGTMADQFGQLEEMRSDLDADAADNAALRRIVADASEGDETIRQASDKLKALDAILDARRKANAAQDAAVALHRLICDVETGEVLTARGVPDLSAVEAAREIVRQAKANADAVHKLIQDAEVADLSVAALTIDRDAAETELMGFKLCPECGRPL
jgi:DNA repair ATPase RecN